MKELYEAPELEIITFNNIRDVITTSVCSVCPQDAYGENIFG